MNEIMKTEIQIESERFPDGNVNNVKTKKRILYNIIFTFDDEYIPVPMQISGSAIYPIKDEIRQKELIYNYHIRIRLSDAKVKDLPSKVQEELDKRTTDPLKIDKEQFNNLQLLID
jgi:hypothetical protein